MMSWLPQETIRIKRDGGALDAADLARIARALADGSLSDAQAGAFAMAVWLRGMSFAECAAWTRAVRDSGETLDWSGESPPGPILDKHSTGGVGDLVSLALGPMLAACGAWVPMIVGRGLAHTGGGELRGGSNVGGGQMVAADFILTPAVVFNENNAGGLGGALGGLLGGKSAVLGAVAGGLKFKEAQTSMLVADARSGVQVASAEGSTKKADLSLGVGLFGGGAAGGVGGYGNTNEGKIIAASFADNYNNIVRVVRNDPNLQREVGSLAQEAAAGGSTKAGAVFNEGDVLYPKIAGVKIMAAAGEAGKAVATLDKGEELIYMGVEENGFLKVESGKGGGWVKKILVTK